MNDLHDLLRQLVAFKTVTGDTDAANAALDFITTFLETRGLSVERLAFNGYPALYASVDGTKTPKVLLGAHLDVVPADNTEFTLREADGKLYGRGTVDMKFAIAAYLQAIDTLQDSIQAFDLGVMITTDEENGGANGTGPMTAAGYLPQVCILPDGGDDWQVQTYSKGFMSAKITAHGKPAHGSRPWLGDNAIMNLYDLLRATRSLFPSDMTADTNTLNIGTIRGGDTYNQVPPTATAVLDIRLYSEAERAPLQQSLRDLAARYGADIDIWLNGAVGAFDLKDPLIAPFVSAIEDITGKTVTGSRTLGSSDARFFAEYGVPCISLYPTGGGHHGPEEWLDAAAFDQFYEVLMRYLNEVARR